MQRHAIAPPAAETSLLQKLLWAYSIGVKWLSNAERMRAVAQETTPLGARVCEGRVFPRACPQHPDCEGLWQGFVYRKCMFMAERQPLLP